MPDCDGAVAPPGVAPGPLTDWFAAVLGAAPPLRFGRLAGGYSNLTFLVSDAAGECWVLRRPPLGHVLATAHDVGREGGIMAALAGTGVPVPAVLGQTADPRWNEAPFFVMSYVPGRVLRTPSDAAALGGGDHAAVACALFDVLAGHPRRGPGRDRPGPAGPPRLLRRSASSAAGTGSSRTSAPATCR